MQLLALRAEMKNVHGTPLNERGSAAHPETAWIRAQHRPAGYSFAADVRNLSDSSSPIRRTFGRSNPGTVCWLRTVATREPRFKLRMVVGFTPAAPYLHCSMRICLAWEKRHARHSMKRDSPDRCVVNALRWSRMLHQRSAATKDNHRLQV